MNGRMIGFIVWGIIGCFLIGLGIAAFFQKKAMNFWANVKTGPVTDIQKYNHAVGKLLILYGAIFIVLGTPLLMKQNSPLILLSVLGVMIETIIIMTIYSLAIETKYRQK